MPEPEVTPVDTSNAGTIKLNTESLRASTAQANDFAVSQYKTAWGNWSRNVSLRAAAGQPAETEPTPPSIKLLDEEKFKQLLTAYIEKILGGGPAGEFDPSTAFTSTAYPALTLPMLPPEPGQPDNPVGQSMGGGYYAAAPGDRHPDGYVFTNPFGVRFRKYAVPTPFSTAQWYQVIA